MTLAHARMRHDPARPRFPHSAEDGYLIFMKPPQAIVLSGPNGAGKSTAAPRLLRDELHVQAFVNADVIARGLSGFAPEHVQRQAGTILLQRLDDLQTRRESFAFETTLAGRGHAQRVRDLVRIGYRVHLLYLWLPSADMAVSRVQGRVRAGGHHIPDHVVRRRYQRSLENLTTLYLPAVSAWRIYDGRGRKDNLVPLVARGESGRTAAVHDQETWDKILRQAPSLPRITP